MRSESRLFGVLTAFLYGVGVVYGLWTWLESGSVEWAGTVALLLSGTLCGMCGLYLLLVARRIPPRPEDRPDAEIADGSGDVGFFSPGSYWPLGIALAASFAALGIVHRQWWLVGAGLATSVGAVAGLLFEYYTGSRRSAGHG